VIARIRNDYDYILVDSASDMGALTANGLCASDYVLIPMKMEFLSIQGLNLLLGRIKEARRENPELGIAGAVGTIVEPGHANGTAQVSLRLALGKHDIKVFQTAIKRASKFAAAVYERRVLVDTSPRSEFAEAYRLLLAELLAVIGGVAALMVDNEKGEQSRNGIQVSKRRAEDLKV
jgi:chromosome partitioning protein